MVLLSLCESNIEGAKYHVFTGNESTVKATVALHVASLGARRNRVYFTSIRLVHIGNIACNADFMIKCREYEAALLTATRRICCQYSRRLKKSVLIDDWSGKLITRQMAAESHAGMQQLDLGGHHANSAELIACAQGKYHS